jgi:hypothetical protein
MGDGCFLRPFFSSFNKSSVRRTAVALIPTQWCLQSILLLWTEMMARLLITERSAMHASLLPRFRKNESVQQQHSFAPHASSKMIFTE